MVAIPGADWPLVLVFAQARTASGVTMIELYEQQVAETRRMNAILERIAAAEPKRASSWARLRVPGKRRFV